FFYIFYFFFQAEDGIRDFHVTGVQTCALPISISTDVMLKFCQRFLLVLILILIFEIIDLIEDDPMLRTVPQIIGVKMTKWLNIFLLIPFYCLEFFKSTVDSKQLMINIVLVVATALFTVFATPERNKYYTLFWVESIPVF